MASGRSGKKINLFDHLPDELIRPSGDSSQPPVSIGDFLSSVDIVNLSAVDKRFFSLFKASAVKALLQHIAYGEKDKAEALLERNPRLLFERGTVTDYAVFGRAGDPANPPAVSERLL